jgi:hypothetical protein
MRGFAIYIFCFLLGSWFASIFDAGAGSQTEHFPIIRQEAHQKVNQCEEIEFY